MIGLVVVGLGLLLTAQLLEWTSAWASRSLSDRVESLVLTLLDEAPETDRRGLFIVDAAGRPSAAELDRFAAALTERFGRAKSVGIVSISSRSSNMEMIAAATLRFGNEEALATIRLQVVPGSMHELALLGVQVLDRTRGDLTVGDMDGESRPVEAPAAVPEDAGP